MASKKSAAYWKKRFELLEQSQNQQGVQCYAELERKYRQAQRQIEAQIQSWYGRFASNNGISIQDARKMLTNKELAEFKWSVYDYIKYGEENAVNQQWVKELENASARYHISRLEALKLQTQQQIEVLFGNQLDSIDSAMKSIYTSGYYHTAYEIQKGFGVGWDFATLDESQINKIINKPWAVDGQNFSSRIWKNKQKLVNELNTTLTQNIILGQDPQKAIDKIAKTLNASKYNVRRLVLTEAAFFNSAARQDCFKELDVDQYEVIVSYDEKTCDICQEMEGKHFMRSQWEVGITAPPFHVNCRCDTIPYFDDEFSAMGTKAARDKNGKTIFIPANMTYEEWQKSFVEGDKSGLKEVKTDDTINSMDITNEWTKVKGIKGTVTERQEYIVNGTTYKVDGKHVILHPTKQEREVAAVLSGKYGKHVEFVPQIMHPQGIQTPDYLVDGDRFDLKSPTGRGKNVLYGMLAKKKRQSPNFIFDITECPLSEEDIIRQIEGIYASRHTSFVEKIVVFKNGDILKVFDRQ